MNNMERISELQVKIRQSLDNKEALIENKDYLGFKGADTTKVDADIAEVRANIKATSAELKALLDAESAEEKEKELQAKIKQKFEAKQPLLREQARLRLNSKDTAEVDGKIAEIEASIGSLEAELWQLRKAKYTVDDAEKSEAAEEESTDKKIKDLQFMLEFAYCQLNLYVFSCPTTTEEKAEIEANIEKEKEKIDIIKSKLTLLGVKPEEWEPLDVFNIPSQECGEIKKEKTKISVAFDVFVQQYNDAKKYNSKDKFVIRPWENWMDTVADRASVIDLLSYVYDVSKNGFDEIAKQYKSLRELSDKFNIPYSTVQKWGAEKAMPPEYLLTMMAYITIIK